MTPRKWFCDEKTFEWTDEMALEARTRSITFTTYPTLTDDKGYYVFTEKELRQFANFVWYDALDHKMTELPDQFESYWQQKFGGGEK